MKYLASLLFFLFTAQGLNAQTLKLKPRRADARGGKAFAISISDSTLTLQQREEIIFNEIKSGNVPDFLRKLKEIKMDFGWDIYKITTSITYYVLPDYFCIGNNDDFFYIPMTPILAQKVANLTECSLPTKKMVDSIYKNASIKLFPQPISPTKNMIALPVFIAHNDSIRMQLIPYLLKHNNSELTAGHKKDVVISNKIYTETKPKVVIYGWHKIDGNPIQPVYNKHANTWADYSHGIRLVQNRVWVNGKKTTVVKILADKKLCQLLSDEDLIEKPYYPIVDNY